MASTNHEIYLAFGSNLGDRLDNLRLAMENLSPKIKVVAISPVYETEPWGYGDQPRFLNQVCAARTRLSPHSLLAYLKGVETRLGRQPTFHFGPRLIDLDILFYDDLELESPQLVIPHPRLHERAFVLVPFAQIAPQLCHPRLKKTISELLAEVSQDGVSLFQPG